MKQLRIDPDGININAEIRDEVKTNQWIVFSHGFGVEMHSMGMFSDIAERLANYNYVMFDYSKILSNGDQEIFGIQDFVKQITRVYEYIQQSYANVEFNFIGHSAGNLYLSESTIANKPFNKVVFLAPVIENMYHDYIEYFSKREGSVLDVNGISKLMRSTGKYTIVHKEYYDFMRDINPLESYKKVKYFNEAIEISAKNDEMITKTTYLDFKVPGFKAEELQGNHNFTGEYREGLLERMKAVFPV